MEVPSKTMLKEMHGITPETELEVLKRGIAIGESLQAPTEHTVAIIGSCAMTNHKEELLEEGRRIAALNQEGLLTVQRAPVWKPRTNPEKDWEGLETGLVEIAEDGKGYGVPGTETEGATAAYDILASLATDQPAPAIELNNEDHIKNYGSMISFGWVGSRDVGNTEHILKLARRDPMTPLGIKNGIDGTIDEALQVTGQVNSIRTSIDRSAPAILIFRGGSTKQTPELWEDGYVEALERTNGQLIVDVAHGSEMAHDPEGKFAKSVAGQEAAMETVIRLAKDGHIPAGIMIEASDIPSPTDPVMPLDVALHGVKRLHQIKQQLHRTDRQP